MPPFAPTCNEELVRRVSLAQSPRQISWTSSYRDLRNVHPAVHRTGQHARLLAWQTVEMGHSSQASRLTVQAAQNIFSHAAVVSREQKQQISRQRSFCVWSTGTSASGKTAINKELEQLLAENGFLTTFLDGDNLRKGLNSNLGFSMADRDENLRRTSCAAKLAVDSAVIAVAGLISPLREQRLAMRAMFAEGDFILVHVDTPLETCIDRDPNGLYKKAIAGQIPNFTGINSPYEAPVDGEAQIVLKAYDEDGRLRTPREHAKTILEYLWHNGYLTRPGCSTPDMTLNELHAL